MRVLEGVGSFGKKLERSSGCGQLEGEPRRNLGEAGSSGGDRGESSGQAALEEAENEPRGGLRGVGSSRESR